MTVSDPPSPPPAAGRVARLRARLAGHARRARTTVEAARTRSQVVDAAVLTYERDRRTAGTFVLIGGLQALRQRSTVLGLGVTLAGIVPFVLLWLLVSRLLPHDPRAPWHGLLPGALLVGTPLWAAQVLSVYYLAHRVDSASELYGSLGVAAAILAWLYLIGRLMVGSAMLNAALWDQRTRPPEPES